MELESRFAQNSKSVRRLKRIARTSQSRSWVENCLHIASPSLRLVEVSSAQMRDSRNTPQASVCPLLSSRRQACRDPRSCLGPLHRSPQPNVPFAPARQRSADVQRTYGTCIGTRYRPQNKDLARPLYRALRHKRRVWARVTLSCSRQAPTADIATICAGGQRLQYCTYRRGTWELLTFGLQSERGPVQISPCIRAVPNYPDGW